MRWPRPTGRSTIVEHLADIDDQESADEKINSFLAARGDEIDGIVTSAYVPSTVSATALRNLGDGRIRMVGIDDDPIVLDAIRDGIIDGTMAQNPYGQAFVGSKSWPCWRTAAPAEGCPLLRELRHAAHLARQRRDLRRGPQGPHRGDRRDLPRAVPGLPLGRTR